MKKYTLSVYEKAMPEELSPKQKLQAAKSAGFDAVELSVDESDEKLARLEMRGEERKKLRKLGGESIHFNSICLSGHRRFPLGSKDLATRKRAEEIMTGAVELAYDLGINIIQLAGYDDYYEKEGPGDAETEKLYTDNLAKAAEYAGRRGILLGIETMETDFCNTVAKGMRFVKAVDSPYLQMYPDVGNMTNGTDDVIADLESGRGHIIAVHLKETKENVFRDLTYGDGRVDFYGCAKKCSELGITMFNGEYWHKKGEDYLAELKYAGGFLRNILDEVYK